MEFEWDERKNQSNRKKHGIDFQEASTAFGDELALTFDDPDHSVGEERFILFGKTVTEKYTVIAYTWRSDDIRIISARLMEKSEKRIYQDE